MWKNYLITKNFGKQLTLFLVKLKPAFSDDRELANLMNSSIFVDIEVELRFEISFDELLEKFQYHPSIKRIR